MPGYNYIVLYTTREFVHVGRVRTRTDMPRNIDVPVVWVWFLDGTTSTNTRKAKYVLEYTEDHSPRVCMRNYYYCSIAVVYPNRERETHELVVGSIDDPELIASL